MLYNDLPMFKETPITATITAYTNGTGFITWTAIIFKTPTRTIKQITANERQPELFNRIEAIKREKKPGDKIQLIKVGSGKYAGYKLA